MPECHRPRTRHAGPPIVIPAKSLPRTPIRGRNPEGRWEARPPPVLVRKHVPDYDPGCALQSTSMTALRRRNLPNCRPMAEGGMRKCSAGACPPLGLGVGRGRIRRANSLYQTTTPAFHTSVCRLPLESPRTRHAGPPIVIPAKAGIQRGGAGGGKTAASLDTKACPGLRSGMNRSRHDRSSRHAGVRWNPLALVMPAPQSSFPRRACPVPRYGAGIQRGGVGAGKTAASLTLVNSDYPLRHPGESPGQNLSNRRSPLVAANTRESKTPVASPA